MGTIKDRQPLEARCLGTGKESFQSLPRLAPGKLCHSELGMMWRLIFIVMIGLRNASEISTVHIHTCMCTHMPTHTHIECVWEDVCESAAM